MRFSKFVVFAILLLIVLLAYTVLVEPVLLAVNYENINSPLINENIRIVQFSDTHISKYFNMEDLKKTVHRINEQKPTIVVFTGDLFDRYNEYENKDNINEIWEILSEIKAPLGKFAVYGNHDYGGGAERVYRHIMENSGFQLLINEKVKLEEENINIIGMDDSIFGTFQKEVITDYLEEDYYNIVLSHEPDVAEHLLEYNLDLFLAGHSHGGQINLPFIGCTPPLAQKYIRGMYNIENYRETKIYVNVGLGTSMLPMRFMAIPELTVFNLYVK
ncbi:MAG: metallophosphoesterase [Tissierellia bacterium]|nr:metallophosphoesterase [Tissierellia bacterium]